MYGTLSTVFDFQDMLVGVLEYDLHIKGGESNRCLYHEAARYLKVAFH